MDQNQSNKPNPALTAMEQLYQEVDRKTQRLDEILGARLKCRRRCTSCCTDGITIFAVEAAYIQSQCAEFFAVAKPHPVGACVMLDAEGACRIYANRPYVCRTHGYPLRWIEEVYDGEPVEMRDICPLNEEGTPIEELSEYACWTIGPIEERLAFLESVFQNGEKQRVALRDLIPGKS